jgi:EAL domain-containing protein (putative c-di-GMP-specific phosphodiesterase class I)
MSSLAHLRQLPVDTLKIDLAFVRGATTDADDASVVTAVIAVAHSLGLRVVAQGVESEAQVTLLRSLGCDEVQGYLWSPPLPAAECERILVQGLLQASPPRRAHGGGASPAARRRGRGKR